VSSPYALIFCYCCSVTFKNLYTWDGIAYYTWDDIAYFSIYSIKINRLLVLHLALLYSKTSQYVYTEAVCNSQHFNKPTRAEFLAHAREALRSYNKDIESISANDMIIINMRELHAIIGRMAMKKMSLIWTHMMKTINLCKQNICPWKYPGFFRGKFLLIYQQQFFA